MLSAPSTIRNLIYLLLLCSPFVQGYCDLKKATVREYVFVPPSDPFYKELQTNLCSTTSPGEFDSVISGLSMEANPNSTDLARDSYQLNDVLNIIEGSNLYIQDFEKIPMGIQALQLAEAIATSAARLKHDPLRSEYLKEETTAPGQCDIWDNLSKTLVYCDENFTTVALQPVVRLANILRRNGDQYPNKQKQLIELTRQVVDYYREKQWKVFDVRYGAALEYIGESFHQNKTSPMHNNGLAEYSILLLELYDYLWAIGDTSASTYIGEARKIVEHINGSIDHVIDESKEKPELFCNWRYIAGGTRIDDAEHGVAILKLLLISKENPQYQLDLSLDITDALITTFMVHGLEGNMHDGTIKLKARVLPGLHTDPKLPTVLEVCQKNIDVWRFSKDHLRYCAKALKMGQCPAGYWPSTN